MDADDADTAAPDPASEPIATSAPDEPGLTSDAEFSLEAAPAPSPPPNVGGRRRRRQALVVVGIAVVSAAAGIGIGSRLKSPADEAAARRAPAPSRITVPVEKRALSAAVALSGTVEFEQPTPVRLAGNVGASAGTTQVVTRPPTIDQELVDGGVVAEISGRPVFAFQGALPVFRALEPGATGPDVTELETALARLGFDPGPVDQTYDARTEAAVDAFYTSKGYASEGPTEDQRKALRDATKAVVTAEQQLATAKEALAKGATTAASADRLEAQQQLQKATDAVPAAQAAAKRANDDATAVLATDTALRDSAKAARDAAKAARDAAKTIATEAAKPDAINPVTAAPYTAIELADTQATVAEKESVLADKEAGLITAQQEMNKATSAQTDTAASGEKNVQDANDALALAKARLADLNRPPDTASLADGVKAAQSVVDQAHRDQATAAAESGTKVPAGEMVFLPTLPSTITAVTVVAGDAAPSGPLATVSSTDTRLTARISRNDAALVKTGMEVAITLTDANLETTGTVASVGPPPVTAGDSSGSGGKTAGSGSGSGSTSTAGRIEVVVTPTEPAKLRDWVGSTARLSIPVSSTNGKVLAVPVAALFVGPDGTSQVEVETAKATDTDPGATTLLTVKVGLTAQGFAEIAPVKGSLSPGDRVVVGSRTATTGTTVVSATTAGSATTASSATTAKSTSSKASAASTPAPKSTATPQAAATATDVAVASP